MREHEVEAYLHEHIPISRAMGVRVECACFDKVALAAPLVPNINHRDTVFGGSASAVAILAAWTLLHYRLRQTALHTRLVIQRNTMHYDNPIVEDFEAISTIPEASEWEKFLVFLQRKKRARIKVDVTLRCAGESVGRLDGEFVALTLDARTVDGSKA